MNTKKIIKYFRQNIYIAIFILVTIFVGILLISKTFSGNSEYVYAKIKLGQGLWWVTAAKPNLWLIQAIKIGEKENDLLGRPTSEIKSFRYYPSGSSSSFDGYLVVKLKVGYNEKTGKYIFKRTPLVVSQPIELEFPSVSITGTVIELNRSNFQDAYVTKSITLTKKQAFPWEFNAIKIGDSYFDGTEKVFEVLSKDFINTSVIDIGTYLPNPLTVDNRQYITVKVKMRLKSQNGKLIFGEEQIITPGKSFNFLADEFGFENFYTESVE